MDQRAVTDAGFLDLVRLGVYRADDPVIVNSVRVTDKEISFTTPTGQFWHRYTKDGYGEQADGSPWDYTFPAESRTTFGRLWPLLAGERGEYELTLGDHSPNEHPAGGDSHAIAIFDAFRSRQPFQRPSPWSWPSAGPFARWPTLGSERLWSSAQTINLDEIKMSLAKYEDKPVGQIGIYTQGDTPASSNFVTGRFIIDPGKTPHRPHVHPEEEVMIVETGHGEIFCDGKTTKVGPGSVMFTTPNAPHGINNTGTRAAHVLLREVGEEVNRVSCQLPVASCQ